jgi:uncharacterized repeat protein (TIGR03803 family)
MKILWLMLVAATVLTSGAQTLQTLCSFNFTNGANPYAALTLGNDGNFYGTANSGGITNSTFPNGLGTIFKVTTNGTLTSLVSFANTNGASPYAALTLGNDGNFYGTTYQGGSIGGGTVFRLGTNGELAMLVSFDGTNGAGPFAALTLGNDGNFYGTTIGGGITNSTFPYGLGTVFKVTTNGLLTTLTSFSLTNGASPYGKLALGNDGIFYGTTFSGGITNSTIPGAFPRGLGTVFKVMTNGTLTSLFSFSNTNGANPTAGLTLGNDGSFYGTTFFGSGVDGTVFKVTTNGTLTTLVLFTNSLFVYTNGANPHAALTLGNDSNFYGNTEGGGIYDNGTIFMLSTNGALTTLVSLENTNNNTAPPCASMFTLGNDGNFYATSIQSGNTNTAFSLGMGTVFRLILPPVIVVQSQSQTNNAGATVTFTVSATSLTPMSFQWQKNGTNLVNGVNISGATTNTLIITGISDSDAASYSVIISNANSSVTSSNVILTVIYPPTLALQFLAGYPLLDLNGMLSNNFVVQYSTNLADPYWINLLSISNLSASPYQFMDPVGSSQSMRFYRAVMQ